MIETCTKRRMILSIVALALLTVVVLILEAKLTSNSSYGSETPQPLVHINTSGARAKSPAPLSSSSTSGAPNTSLCDSVSVVQACQPCSTYEINSNSPVACQTTGFKEIIKCNTSEKTEIRSCSLELSREKTRFLVFESLSLLVFLLSYGYSRLRRSQLERRTIKEIERRLAAGH